MIGLVLAYVSGMQSLRDVIGGNLQWPFKQPIV